MISMRAMLFLALVASVYCVEVKSSQSNQGFTESNLKYTKAELSVAKNGHGFVSMVCVAAIGGLYAFKPFLGPGTNETCLVYVLCQFGLNFHFYQHFSSLLHVHNDAENTKLIGISKSFYSFYKAIMYCQYFEKDKQKIDFEATIGLGSKKAWLSQDGLNEHLGRLAKRPGILFMPFWFLKASLAGYKVSS
ncbi:hypothetical protein IPH25_03175 [bacterium]|nr:MAG: hypothetical protein IPG37_00165 [bacterium]QQR61469.1 MAG: hypothetical protein IPH25_03175 [bacterium]QQR63005.1 MAG: hypothetical protein IPH67_00835 [bacterium]